MIKYYPRISYKTSDAVEFARVDVLTVSVARSLGHSSIIMTKKLNGLIMVK